jgi:hypothetical protein
VGSMQSAGSRNSHYLAEMEGEGLDGESESIELTLERAHRAIARAKVLTTVFSRAGEAIRASMQEGGAGGTGTVTEEGDHLDATRAAAASEDSADAPQSSMQSSNMQQLRLFLSAQLASSQSILGQLQQQQRRADDLVSRLGALRSAHAQRAQARMAGASTAAETAAEEPAGEQQQQEQQQRPQEEEEAAAGPCEEAGPMQEEERMARMEALRSAALRMDDDMSSRPAPHEQHDNPDEQDEGALLRPPSPPMHPDSVLVLSDPAAAAAPADADRGQQPGPLQRVAMRLAVLQAQQSNTLQQLINLRLEQLR